MNFTKIYVIASFLSVTVVLFSCSHAPEINLSFYRAVNKTLQSSTDHYENETLEMLERLKEYSLQPKISSQVLRILEQVNFVHEKSIACDYYIYCLKDSLKKECGLTIVDGIQSFRQDDFNAVKTLFELKGKAEELKQKMNAYESDILQSDKNIESKFKYNCHFYDVSLIEADKTQNSFIQNYFSNLPADCALISLSKFQSDIRLYENKIITFYSEQLTN